MDIQQNNNILPKSFESNKLINPEIIIEEEEDEDEDNIEDEIDEMDEETLEIINRIRLKKLESDNSPIFLEKKLNNLKENSEKIKKTPKKENKKISFQEFSKSIESENKTIKKFTSSRVENKKNQYDNTLIPKRHFNPRKPPYNFTRKVSITNVLEYNNVQEFPQLK